LIDTETDTRVLGGGFHRVILDTVRDGSLENYLD